jgi:hypothetical protein
MDACTGYIKLQRSSTFEKILAHHVLSTEINMEIKSMHDICFMYSLAAYSLTELIIVIMPM